MWIFIDELRENPYWPLFFTFDISVMVKDCQLQVGSNEIKRLHEKVREIFQLLIIDFKGLVSLGNLSSSSFFFSCKYPNFIWSNTRCRSSCFYQTQACQFPRNIFWGHPFWPTSGCSTCPSKPRLRAGAILRAVSDSVPLLLLCWVIFLSVYTRVI